MIIWKTIPGYSQIKVSNDGRITVNGKARKLCWLGKGRGYLTLRLDGAILYFHRLVTLAFIGLPPVSDDTVNHLDGDRSNNYPTNLEWISRKGNGIHQRDILGQAKLNRQKVMEIKQWLLENGTHYGYRMLLAKKFNCCRRTIDCVVTGKRWSDI